MEYSFFYHPHGGLKEAHKYGSRQIYKFRDWSAIWRGCGFARANGLQPKAVSAERFTDHPSPYLPLRSDRPCTARSQGVNWDKQNGKCLEKTGKAPKRRMRK